MTDVVLHLEADERGLVTGIRVSRAELGKLGTEAKTSGASVAAAGRQVDHLGRSAAGSSSHIRSAAGAVRRFRGELATLGLIAVTAGIVGVGNAFIGYENALTAATGSQELARDGMAFVRAEAERLGLDVRTLVAGYTQLTAAARGTALEGAETERIFSSVAEQARVLNLSAADTNGILRALVQIMSKGTVQAEELRGQLGERLPGAILAAARALGKTTAELAKMLELGEVVADDLLPNLSRELSKSAAAGLDIATAAPSAEFNRLRNALTELRNDIAQGGVLAALAAGARGAAEAVKFLRENGRTLVAVLAGIVSGAVLGPLVTGFVSATAAVLSLDRASAGLVIRMTAARAVMSTTAASATVLRGALGLLGGAAGVVIGVGTALAVLAATSRDTSADIKTLADEVEDLIERLDKLNSRQLESAIEKLQLRSADILDEIDRLNAEIDRRLNERAQARVNIVGGFAVSNPEGAGARDPIIGDLRRQVAAYHDELVRLEAELAKAGVAQSQLNESTRKGAASTKDDEKAKRAAAKAAAELAQALARLEQSYISSLRAVDPLAALQAQYVADVRDTAAELLVAGVSAAQVDRVIRALAAAFVANRRELVENSDEAKALAKELAEARDWALEFLDSVEQLLQRLDPVRAATAAYANDVRLLAQAVALGVIGVDELDEAIERLKEQFEDRGFAQAAAGTIADFVSTLASGGNEALAFASGLNSLSQAMREGKFGERAKEMEGLQDAVSGAASALAASQSGGPAGLNALSAGISAFAATGNPYVAAAAAIAAFVLTSGDKQPFAQITSGGVSRSATPVSGDGDVDFLARQTALGGFRFAQEHGVDITNISAQVQQFDQAVAQILGRSLSEQAAAALAGSVSTFEGNQANIRAILEDRFNQILNSVGEVISGAVLAFGGGLEQQIAALGAAVEIERLQGLGDDIFQGRLGVADLFDALVALRAPGEELAATYERLRISTDSYRLALQLAGQSVDAGAVAIVAAAGAIAEAAGGAEAAAALFDRVFEAFFDPQEVIQAQLAAARERSGRLLSQAGLGAATTPEEFRAAFEAALALGDPEVIAALLLAGGALADVVDLEAELVEIRRAAADDARTAADAAQQQAIANAQALEGVLSGVSDLAERLLLSQFQRDMRGLAREFVQAREAANALGASQEQLAAIERTFAQATARLIADLRIDIQSMADALFGDPAGIDQRIAELQARERGRIEDVDRSSQARYQAELRNIERVRAALDQILLDTSVTTLTPRERLAEARRQFEEAEAAARGGDTSALPGAARTLIEELRSFFASSGPFPEEFDRIIGILREFGEGVPQVPTDTGAAGVGGLSAAERSELTRLLADRDDRLARESASARRLQAIDLARAIHDLADATGETIESVAEAFGIDPEALADALGIEFDDLGTFFEGLGGAAARQLSALDALNATEALALANLQVIAAALGAKPAIDDTIGLYRPGIGTRGTPTNPDKAGSSTVAGLFGDVAVKVTQLLEAIARGELTKPGVDELTAFNHLRDIAGNTATTASEVTNIRLGGQDGPRLRRPGDPGGRR